MSCARNDVPVKSSPLRQSQGSSFVSEDYNHFDGGVLFTDVAFGLDILWSASFRKGRAYKETVGLFVPAGLLVLPNESNGVDHGNLGALPKRIVRGQLLVFFQEHWIEVLGIIHTHPMSTRSPIPSPRNDFQYCYLGLHNYVMDQRHLMDAYKDDFKRERFRMLGQRTDYHRLPFVKAQPLIVAQ